MENRGTNLKISLCDVFRESQMSQNPKNLKHISLHTQWKNDREA